MCNNDDAVIHMRDNKDDLLLWMSADICAPSMHVMKSIRKRRGAIIMIAIRHDEHNNFRKESRRRIYQKHHPLRYGMILAAPVR